ncbi:hypothetical protein ABZ946_35080 [Streptomyces sp. NPDC046324]|uniref:hypothetical protein n=1 Tax=Streptomyces sp. NPDC046324 TaxID=3154915 RepID=UPI0033C894C7
MAPSPNSGALRRCQAGTDSYSVGVDGKGQKGTDKINEPLEISESKVLSHCPRRWPAITFEAVVGGLVYPNATRLLPLDDFMPSSGVLDVGDGWPL